MSEKLGIFGGTFDPPHLGHLILAKSARTSLGLDRVLWVLTPTPPHKQGNEISAARHRFEMLNLMLANQTGFELSTVEIDRPGPHYTIDTLRALKTLHPAAKLTLILGGDSLADLPTWRDPEGILQTCEQIGVFHRPQDKVDMNLLEEKIPGIGKKVEFIDAPRVDISSHDIRNRIKNRIEYQNLLTSEIADYIEKHSLYK